MKRLYIAIALFLSFIGIGRIQAQSFNGGVIAGATFCQVDGDNYAGFHQLGFTAGFFANLPLSDYWSAQLELKYSLLGAHSSDKEVSEYYYTPYNLRLHYAEIPLMIRYNFGAFQVRFLTLEAGVSLDFRMRATEDVDGDFQVTSSRWNVFSATANAGLQFSIGNHFGIGARFMYSVVPCRFTGNPGWFYNQYYNKVVQVTLTYTIKSPLR
jgi:hypothetical protein